MNSTSENKNISIFLILMLFGSFCIGYNIAIAFHELGHAFAMMLDGGQIREFVLNPFSWSWNLGQDLNNPLFTAWGGVTFGLLFAILPTIILIWVKRYYFRIPILVMAGSAFLINGIYLIIGVFLNFGDGGELIQYGVSPVLISVLGIFYFLISIILWAIIQLLLGIKSNVSFSKRLVVLRNGVLVSTNQNGGQTAVNKAEGYWSVKEFYKRGDYTLIGNVFDN